MNWISVPALQVEGRSWKNSKTLKKEQNVKSCVRLQVLVCLESCKEHGFGVRNLGSKVISTGLT